MHTRITKIQKVGNEKWKTYRKFETLIYCHGGDKVVLSLWTLIWKIASYKVMHSITIPLSNSIIRYLVQRNENIFPKRLVYE